MFMDVLPLKTHKCVNTSLSTPGCLCDFNWFYMILYPLRWCPRVWNALFSHEGPGPPSRSSSKGSRRSSKASSKGPNSRPISALALSSQLQEVSVWRRMENIDAANSCQVVSSSSFSGEVAPEPEVTEPDPPLQQRWPWLTRAGATGISEEEWWWGCTVMISVMYRAKMLTPLRYWIFHWYSALNFSESSVATILWPNTGDIQWITWQCCLSTPPTGEAPSQVAASHVRPSPVMRDHLAATQMTRRSLSWLLIPFP